MTLAVEKRCVLLVCGFGDPNAMIIEHSYFKLPEDVEAKVWRYLSFTKYVALLRSRSLFFGRVDTFDDPYEGTIPECALREFECSLGSLKLGSDECRRLAEE